MQLEVSAAVLVPRPETELLVDWAGELLRSRSATGAGNAPAPDSVRVLQPTAKPRVTLITCYPFNYVGAAPKRLVVVA